jgi:hypothetical protein
MTGRHGLRDKMEEQRIESIWHSSERCLVNHKKDVPNHKKERQERHEHRWRSTSTVSTKKGFLSPLFRCYTVLLSMLSML